MRSMKEIVASGKVKYVGSKSRDLIAMVAIPWTWYRSILRPPARKASPGKWGKNGPKNGKNGPKFHFQPFYRTFSPHFSGNAKFHFAGHFLSHSGLRPEMDLYQVHRFATRRQLSERKGRGFDQGGFSKTFDSRFSWFSRFSRNTGDCSILIKGGGLKEEFIAQSRCFHGSRGFQCKKKRNPPLFNPPPSQHCEI